MKLRLFRRGIREAEARSIRRGILDARAEIAFTMEYGYAPFSVPNGERDELYNEAHTRTIMGAVRKQFFRTAAKVAEAIDFLKENPQ